MRITKACIILCVVATGLGCVESTHQTTKEMGEEYRPQFHFTPPSQWMNDPNGMFFYEGEYHLFYQHYPDSNVWGPMHWGHAVSKDLISWEHLPIAIYPDSLGYIFSGSAVVDWTNSSGFGTDQKTPVVAIFTYHNPAGEKAGRTDFQSQAIAYSLDKGRSWKKYEGNPVLPNQGIRDFRDPKVFWLESAQKWIMTLAEKDHVSFYTSVDLRTWDKASDFGFEYGSHGGVWECPDLFEIAIDGSEQTRWVLLVSINPGGPNGGSATQYFVGDFNGERFQLDSAFEARVQDEAAVWLDYGADNYAGVTWSDVPQDDGRRLFIGWMSNWQYAQVVPTTHWRSAMTIPRSLRLLALHSESFLLKSEPVSEIDHYLSVPSGTDSDKDKGYRLTMSVREGARVTLLNDIGNKVTIEIDADSLFFDRSNSGLVEFEEGFGVVHSMPLGAVKLEKMTVFVDISSIEIFLNDGELVMTELVFPGKILNRFETNDRVSDIEKMMVQSF